jgi:hypothetical protein
MKPRPSPLVALALVLALGTPACFRFDKIEMSHRVRVTTQPADASVWTQDATGKQDVGRAPVDVRKTYVVSKQRFNHWHWLWAILSAGAAGAGGGMYASDSGSASSGAKIGGIVMVTLGASLFLPALILCIAGEVNNGKEYIAKQSVMIGASAPGHGDRWAQLEIPSEQKEVHIALSPGEGGVMLGGLIGKAPGPAADTGATAKRPIVAVFAVQDASKNIAADVLEQLTEYLSAQLAATGRYRIVPRDRLRERIADQRKKSYGACYDEACQIELGKALAAQKSLATKLLRVSNRCALTAVLYDLRTETTETAASVDTECSVEALLGAVRKVAQQLAGPAR